MSNTPEKVPEKERLAKDINENKGEDLGDSEARETWSGKLDFLMSSLSFAVGMGNMWRFPYLCYRNGGGAFLIPYIIMMIVAGFPLMYLEFAFGQYGRHGVVTIWKCVPLFQGIGWAMFLVSAVTVLYYNLLNGWCIFYIAASFAKQVPWATCGNAWNDENCAEQDMIRSRQNCTLNNGTWFNKTCATVATYGEEAYEAIVNHSKELGASRMQSTSDQYFHRYMLDISSGLEEVGEIKWQLVLCSLLAWLIIAVCLSKGIKSSGKATYVTAIFPYIVLLILFGRGVTLDGAKDGILYYLTPEWSRLGSAEVWGDAAVQVFFSLSCCWGGLITLASYNNFHNNCLRDAIFVSTGDCLTSIFGGVVIFSFIGYMAKSLGMPVSEVATQGAGLAFIVYPEAVTTLPISPLWAVLFMLMLINVGIGTAFTLVTTSHTTLLDVFPNQLKKGWRPTILLFVICAVSFLLGLPICTQGGMYILQTLDQYCASYGLLGIGIVMLVALSWVYGIQRLFKDIETMTGNRPGIFILALWKYITPAMLLFILIFTLVFFRRTSYGDVVMPVWADVVGWLIVVLEMGAIPATAVYKILTADSRLSLREKIRVLTTPEDGWGPPSDVKVTKSNDLELKTPLKTDPEV